MKKLCTEYLKYKKQYDTNYVKCTNYGVELLISQDWELNAIVALGKEKEKSSKSLK